MKIIKEEYTLEAVSDTLAEYMSEDCALFDIECTGLSPKNSWIYLIGCASRKRNIITLTQFFSENSQEEKNILEEFDIYLNDFNKVLGFNSTRFDEPYIIERSKKLGLSHQFNRLNHTDLYLTSSKLKCLINLPNYKQKTIEDFLGLHREDIYDGGQLIPVYLDYVDNHNEEALKLVLLHNYEDVKGMVTAIEFLSYLPLLKSTLALSDFEFDTDENSVRVMAKLPFSLPKALNKTRDFGLVMLKDTRVNLISDIQRLTLNTYLKDFKNYVYHTEENMIIPKVLASTIDKCLIRPATREECHASLESSFIRIPEHFEVPSGIMVFKDSFKSKEFFIRAEDVTEYIALQLIKYIIKH